MAKRELPGPEAVIPAHFVTLHGGAASPTSRAVGNSDNRVDIVFVGDGYTAAELPAFHASVDEIVVELFETEPFGRYEDVIAIHRVDVVSNESGVDNDPVEGIDRDTELDMQYWCGGTERALCVNIGKAYSYAQNALTSIRSSRWRTRSTAACVSQLEHLHELRGRTSSPPTS